jgi:hypothetical protein
VRPSRDLLPLALLELEELPDLGLVRQAGRLDHDVLAALEAEPLHDDAVRLVDEILDGAQLERLLGLDQLVTVAHVLDPLDQLSLVAVVLDVRRVLVEAQRATGGVALGPRAVHRDLALVSVGEIHQRLEACHDPGTQRLELVPELRPELVDLALELAVQLLVAVAVLAEVEKVRVGCFVVLRNFQRRCRRLERLHLLTHRF